jgi:excisionase family DNA binding protein
VTLVEAAATLGVQPATLRQQIANGRLRAKKMGRDWQVTKREVQRYRLEVAGKPGRRRKSPAHVS